jgi:hypothetical protein
MMCSTRFLKSIGISYCFQRSLSSAKLRINNNQLTGSAYIYRIIIIKL